MSNKSKGAEIKRTENKIREFDGPGPYPKAVFFIVTNEFCERFSYYGMRTVLSLYLRDKLGFSDDGATVIYHVFSMFVYFFPLLGALIADGWLGRFKTIVYLSMVYACGNILIALTAIPYLNIPGMIFTIIALFLIAFGTGGIKPCVSAFGGDQFKLPEQERYLSTFFSVFYFAINAGSLLSTFLTPVLRHDVHCFGDNDCYSLAFGVPGILMVVSLVVIVLGKPLYKIKNPTTNVLGDVSSCIGHAIVKKCRSKQPRDHWLDHADDKYEKKWIEDIKSALNVLVLFIPLPVFWALFDQQGSRWTFQADRMNQHIGSWTLKADQMQVLNPLLILLFIPLFEVAIYPFMTWCRLIRKPLHKIIWGGILAALAFVISGIVELQLLHTQGISVRENFTQLRIYNSLPCNVSIASEFGNIDVPKVGYYEDLNIPSNNSHESPYKAMKTSGKGCEKFENGIGSQVHLKSKSRSSIFLSSNGTYEFQDNNEKPTSGFNVRVLADVPERETVKIQNVGSSDIKAVFSTDDRSLKNLEDGIYNIDVGEKRVLSNIALKHGGVYTIIVSKQDNSTEYEASVQEITQANSLHILWLVPQYVVMTMGEVMFSVTGLEFSFTQAPDSMKSVLTSAWLLTVAFGNLIVILIVSGSFLDAQWKEFFLFAGLMILDMLIFAFMAYRYKYVAPSSPDSESFLPRKTENAEMAITKVE